MQPPRECARAVLLGHHRTPFLCAPDPSMAHSAEHIMQIVPRRPARRDISEVEA